MKEGGIKYFPVIVLIYFFNSFLLPHGLVYSTILSPLIIYWLWKEGEHVAILTLVGLLGISGLWYIYTGADLRSLTLSSVMIFGVGVFALAVRRYLLKAKSIGKIFDRFLRINSLLVVIAVLIVAFPVIRELLWYEVPISKGISPFPRLKMFTYEASYYAFLFVPIFLFFFWRLIEQKEKHWLMISLAIFIPLILSLSFGVLGSVAAALLLSMLVFRAYLMSFAGHQKMWLYGGFLLVVMLLILLLFPQNPLNQRLANIFSGVDTSAQGRLMESFMFAIDLTRENGIMFGVGPGQIKVLAHDLIINYYKYQGNFAEVVRIPNSMAEWLATYGVVGFSLKLIVEIVLFVKRKLYLNLFNFSLFTFIFIYQFTGSYLVSTAEVMLWGLAFYGQVPSLTIGKARVV